MKINPARFRNLTLLSLLTAVGSGYLLAQPSQVNIAGPVAVSSELLSDALAADKKGDYKDALDYLDRYFKENPTEAAKSNLQQIRSQIAAKIDAQAAAKVAATKVEVKPTAPIPAVIDGGKVTLVASETTTAEKKAAEKAVAAEKKAAEKAAAAKAAAEKKAAAKAAAEKKAAEAAAKADAQIAELLKGNLQGKENLVKHAKTQGAVATVLANTEHKYDDAIKTLDDAILKCSTEPLADEAVAELRALKVEIAADKVQYALDNGDLAEADKAVKELKALEGNSVRYRELRQNQRLQTQDASRLDPEVVNPDFVRRQARVDDLIARGRALWLSGDTDGALKLFGQAETIDHNNLEAAYFIKRIHEGRWQQNRLKYQKTRDTLLDIISESWVLPTAKTGGEIGGPVPPSDSELSKKLKSIKIPEVTFTGLNLSRVVETLNAMAIRNDTSASGTERQGVNIVLQDPSGADPIVNITLRDLTLGRILEYVCEHIGYDFEVREDAVVLQPGSGPTGGVRLRTEFYTINPGMLIRMGVVKPNAAPAGDVGGDIFGGGDSGAGAPAGGEENVEEKLKQFFERSGISFGTVAGSAIAKTDANLIITQTQKNHQKIRGILQEFVAIKQVTIASRFLEVQQGDLQELGFDMLLSGKHSIFATGNRSISTAFQPTLGTGRGITINTTAQQNAVELPDDPATPGIIDPFIGIMETPANSTTFLSPAPQIPSGMNLGSTGPVSGSGLSPAGGTLAHPTANGNFAFAQSLGDYEFEAIVRALSQKQSSDLMSAPTVTTMSEREARISVSQELIYPTEYGDIESEVSNVNGNYNNGGLGGGQMNAAVTITPGTPAGFEKRDVGIVMRVKPTVNDDDTIYLDIEPTVTEFEGFIEYGTPSIALSGNTTVSVPPGFFQPIFTVRTVKSEVTVLDGATVLLGGLSREEVKTVEDKVPVLGDIPFLGRFFSSKGESSQKRQLLIFVTANRVGPNGSTLQTIGNVAPDTIYQDSTLVTPAGPVNRTAE